MNTETELKLKIIELENFIKNQQNKIQSLGNLMYQLTESMNLIIIRQLVLERAFYRIRCQNIFLQSSFAK
ncbi:hypothetical protein PU01_23780 [Hafnia alvei]|nr:hypothetical protein PU01_23780 [Hafnia alvei]STQ70484.1 Uncharacterised protein [Hafnia alvei]